MAFLPHARRCHLPAVLAAWFLLSPRSGALPIATDYAEPCWEVCLDWARQNGKNAELADTRDNLGILDRDQSSRKEYEETLKTHRELARKDPETYLPYVAQTLIELGVLDSDQNRMEDARK